MIDVQREYFAEQSPLRIPDGPLVLEQACATLVEACRETDLLPIVHVRHEEAPGAPVFDSSGPLVETMPEVAPRGIEPNGRQAFAGCLHEDRAQCRAGATHNVNCLVIAGFMTHMCCDTTARQAQERACRSSS